MHVLISHGLAIGAFALIVLGELNFGALRTGTAVYPQWQDFRRDFLKFAVFTITIAGAVTGTGKSISGTGLLRLEVFSGSAVLRLAMLLVAA